MASRVYDELYAEYGWMPTDEEVRPRLERKLGRDRAAASAEDATSRTVAAAGLLAPPGEAPKEEEPHDNSPLSRTTPSRKPILTTAAPTHETKEKKHTRVTGIVKRLLPALSLLALLGILLAGGGAQAAASQQNDGGNQGGRQPFSVTPTYQDVAYANASDTQKLDIYLPSGGDGAFPAVITIHGGAFQFGDKAWIPDPVVKALLNEGYAVVSMNYRLSGEAKFPAAVQDAKAAVRFLRANAANHNLNPDEFVA